MALAEEVLAAGLLAGAALAALVDDRVIPAGGAQGVSYPYVSYKRASTVGTGDLSGGGNLVQLRMQVTAWAETALAALIVAEAVHDLIDPEDGLGLGTFQNQQGANFDIETGHWGVSADYFMWQERN